MDFQPVGNKSQCRNIPVTYVCQQCNFSKFQPPVNHRGPPPPAGLVYKEPPPPNIDPQLWESFKVRHFDMSHVNYF